MTREEILARLERHEIKVEEAARMLEELNQQKRGTLYCKVSPKGALSLYGLQRMPVTLYVEQWERLLDFADQLREFMRQHQNELKRKTR